LEPVVFATRPSELTLEDIRHVIDEEWQEGSQLELKGALPTKGKEADSWMADQSRVGETARNDLVKEVIAFANAYGGWLLLGVEETSDKPARASAIAPLPACAELADRLRLMCRDCIEPQLPIFELRAPDGDEKNCETNPITAQESWRNWHGAMLSDTAVVARVGQAAAATGRDLAAAQPPRPVAPEPPGGCSAPSVAAGAGSLARGGS
jgi:schlafen family protein